MDFHIDFSKDGILSTYEYPNSSLLTVLNAFFIYIDNADKSAVLYYLKDSKSIPIVDFNGLNTDLARNLLANYSEYKYYESAERNYNYTAERTAWNKVIILENQFCEIMGIK